MTKLATAVATIVAVLALVAGPAAAHNLAVDPPGNADSKEGWVGGPAIPGNGEGLIPGGPGGEVLLTPAHAKGLNEACEALRSQGRAATDIFGPPTPAGCPHGT